MSWRQQYSRNATYIQGLNRVVRAEDVEIFPNSLFSLSRCLTIAQRKTGGNAITNIVGPFTGGKTLTAEALILWLRGQGINAGFLPETATRPLRPWEKQGEFVHSVSIKEFWKLHDQGKFVVAYRRMRGDANSEDQSVTYQEKLGGLHVEIVKDRLLTYDVVLMAINAISLIELDHIFIPPIACIVVMPETEVHRKMQVMRGVNARDSSGLNRYGIATDPIHVPGTMWLQNPFVPGVEELKEKERRRRVIPKLICSFDEPLSDFERQFTDRRELDPANRYRTRGELLRALLLRGEYNKGDVDVVLEGERESKSVQAFKRK